MLSAWSSLLSPHAALHAGRGIGVGYSLCTRTHRCASRLPARSVQLRASRVALENGDLVEYRLPPEEAARLPDGRTLGIGCVHDGPVHPLCKWSAEADEFLFDEHAQPLDLSTVERVLDMNRVWFSNRLVGGGLGPGNPHGEESEDCWGLAGVQLSEGTRIVVRPEREVWW